MNENIDLTKILKDCPNGTKFYTSVWGEVSFEKILDREVYTIEIDTVSGYRLLMKEGCYTKSNDAECIIFPSKDQRDWSKFTAPWYKKESEPKFKVGDWVINKLGDSWHIVNLDKKNYKVCDGKGNYNYFPISKQDKMHLWTIQDVKDSDVLVNGSNIFIFHFINNRRLMGYCHVNMDDGNLYNDIGRNECFCTIDAQITPATKEQRDLLFQKIKEAGYKWNVKTNTLDKLVNPKFDPKTLVPFTKVLIWKDLIWIPTMFTFLDFSLEYPRMRYNTIAVKVIPYNNDTKHLIGKTDEAPEYYRYWED